MFLYNNFLLVIYQLLGRWLLMIRLEGFKILWGYCESLKTRSLNLKGSSSHYVKKSCFILGSWIMALSRDLWKDIWGSSYFLSSILRQVSLFYINFWVFLLLRVNWVQSKLIFYVYVSLESSFEAFHHNLFLIVCFTRIPLFPGSILAFLTLLNPSFSMLTP